MEIEKRLCIDIGNSRIKAGMFRGADEQFYDDLNKETLKELLEQEPDVVAVCKSGKNEQIEEMIHQYGKHFYLDYKVPLPIRLNYATPETLGADRIAAAVGAWSLYPQQNVLILDAGTCITLDFLDDKGVYQGGMISPGIHMRFKAMHEFTAGLPMVKFNDNVTFPARSSIESMQVGVYQSIKNELTGYFGSQAEQFNDLIIVDASGFRIHFDKVSNYKIFAQPKLVLYGLDHLARRNA